MQLAAAAGHFEVAQLLLAAGADVKAVDSDGFTALHAAAQNSHVALVKLLLGANCPANATSRYGTPLHVAASSQAEGGWAGGKVTFLMSIGFPPV